ncbi:MAG: hypothetical protein ACI4JM_13125 [Oscillospiraceae bacterium]
MKLLKKTICILAAFAMLSGCELTDTSDDLVIGGTYTSYVPPSQTEQSDEEERETISDVAEDDDTGEKNPDDAGWELRDILLYSVDDSSTVDAFDPNGDELKLVKPGVSYSYNDMLKFVSDNGYLKKHYMFSETVRDKAEYAAFGNYGQHAKASVEKLICGQKTENYSKDDEVLYSDMLICIGQDYNTYDAPNYFSVTLNSTSVTYGFQEALYELLAEQIGSEIAEYVVYAKTIEDGVPEFDLYDTIPSADGYGNLVVQRKITGGSFFLDLDFQDNSEFDEERFAYYDYNYNPLYNDCRFSLSDVFQGDFGGNDPKNDMQFFNTFMKSGGVADNGFTQTIKDNISVISNEGVNKINRSYKYSMRLIKGCVMDFADSPALSCDINSYFDSRTNKNYISGSGSFIAGYTPYGYCDETEAFNQLLGVAREKLACLFPCVDASDIEYSGSMKKTITLSGNYTATSYAIPVNVSVRINPSIKYLQEMDEEGNMIDTETPLYYYVIVSFDLS